MPLEHNSRQEDTVRLYRHCDEKGTWLACEGSFRRFSPGAMEGLYDSLSGEQRELFEEVCTSLPCARSYVQKYAEEHGWNDRMIDQASVFAPAALSRPVPYYKRYWRCFENSFNYAEQHGLLYVEGIAINPAGAMVHAWISTDGRDVLDFTWPYQQVNKYFGIVFDREWLREKGFPAGGLLGHYEKELKERREAKASATVLSSFRL